MKNKLEAIAFVLMLFISTIPLMINVKPAEASITGPSLTVDDTVNQIHATLGAGTGSAVTVKGTVTNLAYPGPPPLLTGVFYRENVGPGITPPDLTISWSMDGITWWPAGPIWCPTAYPGYQLELIIGGGGYWLPPGASSTVYIKTIANRPLGPTDVEVIVFVDTIANSKYDPGEPILTVPPPAYDLPVKIDLSIWNTAELDPAIFFSTIQTAINAATPGQTIYVYPGIYPEIITINKGLTITGDPGDASPGPGANAPILDGSTLGNAKTAVTVTQGVSNVIFEGFEIRNYGTSGNTNEDGVSVWNSGTFNIQISDNYIHHVGYDGVLVGNGWGGPQGLHSGWIITRNIIKNFGAYAIDLENAQNSQITNNSISDPKVPAYGVVILSLGCGTNTIDMSNITVSGNQINNYPDRAVNIMAWAPDAGATATLRNVIVTGNTITGGNFTAITAWKLGPGTVMLRDLTITGNVITVNNPKASGYAVDLSDVSGTNTFNNNNVILTGTLPGGAFFHAINIGGSSTSTWTIDNNQLDGNNLGASNCGFRLRGSLPASVVLTLTHNTITKFANGIRSDALTSGATINVHYNNIAGNSVNGILNGAGAIIDARFNWWGAASGPAHSSNPGGTGDAITNNVDYSPWLGFVVGTSPMTWHVNPTGGSDAIQEAIDEASDGDTIIAHAGTYYESQIIVDKSLKVLGSGADTTVIDGGNVALSNVGLVRITANTGNVTFNGFTVKNAGPAGTVRIVIYAASGTAGPTYTISNNKIYGTNTDDPDDYGFYSHGGKERLIFTNNLITQTGSNPILLEQHTGETEVSYNILDEGFYGSTVYFSMTYGGVNITTPQKVHHNTIDVGTGFHTGSDYYGGGITFNSASHYGTGNGTYTNVQITDNEIINMKGYRRGISLRNDASGDGSGGEISSPIIERNIITGIAGETESIGIQLTGLVTDATVSNNNIIGTYLGIFVQNADPQICNNTITDFIRGGIVIRDSKDILLEGNIISTTLHDEAPNGIDIGTYSGTTGTIKGNEISGCSWNGFTGDYETSWSGSGILVIESGDSLEILGNIVHDCDVGMDIESDSTNITCSNVHNNVYGFIFWNANPKVNYNNIYSNTKYGVYRTTLGNLTGALDARYNWWGDATGPHHPTLNPSGLGNNVSDYVTFAPWLLQEKIPPLVHDIAVISVVPNATAVCAGDIVRIGVTLKNQGNTYETFNVVAYYDSIPINTQTVTDLIPGTNVILTFDWNTAGMSPGDYTMKANASIVPGEIDILDNQLTDGIVKILWHNIAVTAVETFKTLCNCTLTPFDAVYQNYSVSINATVENQGDFAETFNVTAKYDGNIIQTQSVSLAAHTSIYVTFTWDTHGVAKGSYNITVTADLAGDANPGDNTKTYGPVKVTWLGDSDGDFDVDEDDLWDFCSYFITYYTPGKGYMARSILYDFNENCKIDENDLWTFCAAFINYYKST